MVVVSTNTSYIGLYWDEKRMLIGVLESQKKVGCLGKGKILKEKYKSIKDQF